MVKLLHKLVSNYIEPQKNWKLTLLNQWPTIIGNLKDKVRVEKITDTTMVLGVYDSCWMQELYLLTPVLLKTINASLDQERIKELRFKNVARKKVEKKTNTKKNKASKKITFSRSEQLALNRIEDENLRAGLEAFLIRCYKERL